MEDLMVASLHGSNTCLPVSSKPCFQLKTFSFEWLNIYSCSQELACENIRFSSLFAAGDVSRGGASASQRQKFHTDDVKFVRNPVRSADWSTE